MTDKNQCYGSGCGDLFLLSVAGSGLEHMQSFTMSEMPFDPDEKCDYWSYSTKVHLRVNSDVARIQIHSDLDYYHRSVEVAVIKARGWMSRFHELTGRTLMEDNESPEELRPEYCFCEHLCF